MFGLYPQLPLHTHTNTLRKKSCKKQNQKTLAYTIPPSSQIWHGGDISGVFFSLTMRFLSLSVFFWHPPDIQMKGLADSAIGKVGQRERGPLYFYLSPDQFWIEAGLTLCFLRYTNLLKKSKVKLPNLRFSVVYKQPTCTLEKKKKKKRMKRSQK